MTAATGPSWQAALEAQLEPCGLLRQIDVVDEVDSTQDAARRLGLAAGSVVVAVRQTRGRGRLGRPWLDTGHEGLAITAVIPADEAARLSIRGAVAAALAVESLIGRAVGIKWPNDLVLADRKIGGVLIEQHGQQALLGIGINVAQMQWPAELTGRATSLRQCGYDVDRLAVAGALVASINSVWRQPDAFLVEAFQARDALRGRRATLEHDGHTFSGVVTAIDPMHSLTISAGERPLVLPARTTRVLSVADHR